MLLGEEEEEEEGPAPAPRHSDSGFGCRWILMISPGLLVIENGFLCEFG